MKGVVEVTADSRSADAGSLRLQIKDLTEHAGLPEEPRIPPGAAIADDLTEVRNHAQAERTIGGNLLMAAHALGKFSKIAFFQQEQPQMRRTSGYPVPEKILVHGGPEPVVYGRGALEGVQSGARPRMRCTNSPRWMRGPHGNESHGGTFGRGSRRSSMS